MKQCLLEVHASHDEFLVTVSPMDESGAARCYAVFNDRRQVQVFLEQELGLLPEIAADTIRLDNGYNVELSEDALQAICKNQEAHERGLGETTIE